MENLTLHSPELVGSYRCFGSEGPVYQVIAKADFQRVKIIVVETGEELEYPIAKAKQDPVAS